MSGKAEFRVRAADGVRLALHRVPATAPRSLPPVLLVPGTFTARAFWLGARGQGFAGMLADAGFDTWVLEPRGHGQSDRPPRWTMSDWIERDAPAAASFLLEHTGAEDYFWVGHSAGGVVGAAFSGMEHPAARALRGLVLVGSPGPAGMRPLRRVLGQAGYWPTRLLPWLRIPGPALGLGPEWEPGALVSEWLGWNLSGVWRDPEGGDYLGRLAGVEVPVLGVGGAGDHLLAPPGTVRDLIGRFGSADREVLVAGRGTGFRHDYDHAGLLIGRAAREEIWPRLLGWLRHRAGAAHPAPTRDP